MAKPMTPEAVTQMLEGMDKELAQIEERVLLLEVKLLVRKIDAGSTSFTKRELELLAAIGFSTR